MDPRFAGDTIPEADTSDPIGMGGAAVSEVTASKRNWDTSKPTTTPSPTVTGKTVEEVRASLSKLTPEWGKGGGKLSISLEWNGDGTATAVVTAKFFRILPKWVNEKEGDEEARTRWTKMIKHLEVHEQRHLEIAAETAEWLASDVVGLNTDELQAAQDEAIERMKVDHEDLDDESESGTKAGHKYGNVVF